VQARELYPQIELELVQVMSSDALARVRGGALDASFYFGARPEADLAAIELRDIVYRVTMPAAWASELEDAPWETIAAPAVDRRAGTEHAPSARHELFHAPTPSPERIVEADNESVIHNLVESGVGLSPHPRRDCRAVGRCGPHDALARTRSDDPAVARPPGRPRRRSARRCAQRCAAAGVATGSSGDFAGVLSAACARRQPKAASTMPVATVEAP
jgi:hypothetical protein